MLPGSVLKGANGLLKGKAKYPQTLAGRSINAADVKALEEAIPRLRARARVEKAAKQTARIVHSRELALTAGVERFYDRFAAAAGRIFTGPRRSEVLALVPRREEARGKAQGSGGGGANPPGGSSPVGTNPPAGTNPPKAGP